MGLTLARQYPDKPFNKVLQRFAPKYWTIDYNALMVATILPINDRGFKVSAQWRTNSDFLGVRWDSEDRFDHEWFKYSTDNSYRDTILALRANTPEPWKFTCTLTVFDIPYTYRLSPYVLNTETRRWECLEPEYGTGKTYPEEVMWPQDEWTELPTEGDSALVKYLERDDYIFILDFNDIRLYSLYNGPLIPMHNVARISFDTVEWSHGLGRDAKVIGMAAAGPNHTSLQLAGVLPGARLTPGDKIQVVWNFYNDEGLPDHREDVFVVESYTGFGTSSYTVICSGSMNGRQFISSDAMYSRYLAQSSPAQMTDSDKYFVDMRVTGDRTEIMVRDYPQPAHNLMMTSGFDDGYNVTPERQVEMAYALGYRGFWTTYIGMSHYFNARAAYQDIVTGEVIAPPRLLDMPVVFAGQSQAAVMFVYGEYPERGVDYFQRAAAQVFGVSPSDIYPINGATGSTAADRMCAVNPYSEVWDPEQTAGSGGLWWWDLEADKPGPALIHCMIEVGTRIPDSVIWSQGDQDAVAIAFPDGRVPTPSAARSKLATQKVFDYMRTRWGTHLQIFIQEQGWAWTEEIGNTPASAAVYQQVVGNHWGDVRFTWLSLQANPANMTYIVEVLAADNTDVVIRTIQVPGTQMSRGIIYADYPVEMSVPDYGFPPTFIRWRVRTVETGVLSAISAQNVEIDNAWFVKRVVMFGGQSNAFGHFDTLSGADARKDLVSAGEFRRDLAARLGLSSIEVMPVNVSLGSSAAEKLAAENHGDNYWWDLDGNKPGPRLTDLLATMRSLGVPPTEMIWSQGEADATATMAGSGLVTSPARYKAATQAIFAHVRSELGVPNLPIWDQMITRSYWGDRDPLGYAYWWVRETMIEVVKADPNTRMGSWVIGAETIAGYSPEVGNIGRIHYTSPIYHRAARDLAEAIATNFDRIDQKPEWMKLVPITGADAVRSSSNQDIIFNWNPPGGLAVATQVMNLNVVDNSTIDVANVTGGSYTFTAARQTQVYGFATSAAYYTVAPALANGQVGPAVQLIKNVDYWVPPANPAPTGLGAVRQPNDDIVMSWTPIAGKTYQVTNRSVMDNSVISVTNVTGGSLLFTRAQQVAVYGYNASYVVFRVQVIENGNLGDPADYSGAV